MDTVMIENVTVVGSNISFTNIQLTHHRHYNVTISASNIIGSATFHTELSEQGVLLYV